MKPDQTPEYFWIEVKSKLFKSECPPALENMMQQAFLEAKSNSEKFANIASFMFAAKNIIHKKR